MAESAPTVFPCRVCRKTDDDGNLIPLDDPVNCDECEGSGETLHECEYAGCVNEHEGPCPECDGTGLVPKKDESCYCCGTAGDHLGGVCMADLGGPTP